MVYKTLFELFQIISTLINADITRNTRIILLKLVSWLAKKTREKVIFQLKECRKRTRSPQSIRMFCSLEYCNIAINLVRSLADCSKQVPTGTCKLQMYLSSHSLIFEWTICPFFSEKYVEKYDDLLHRVKAAVPYIRNVPNSKIRVAYKDLVCLLQLLRAAPQDNLVLREAFGNVDMT